MKKFAILILLFIISSCGYDKDHVATITYNVHYPNKIVQKSYTFECSDEPAYSLKAYDGNNKLRIYEDSSWPGHGMKELECTTAPIEIVSFIIKE